MATTETIRIVITETGSKTTAAGIRSVAKEATAAEEALSLLKKALVFVGVTSLTREYVQLSSTYQQLQNRIKLVTTSQEQQIAVTKELLSISNQTFTSLQDTTELYARLAFNTKSLKLSQEDLLGVTKAINTAVLLSGAGAREASNALIQFSQGLASGTLRGDELRSVLEQLPFVTDIIAKRFNVTRDALRVLAVQGKITSEEIILAFKDAGPELQAALAKIQPTILQAFTILKNQILAAVGDFDRATGASKFFANAIINLAANLPQVIDLIVKLAFAIGTLLAAQAIGNGIVALQKFRAVTLLTTASTTGLSGALKVLANNLLTVNLLSKGGIAQLGVSIKAAFAAIAANPFGAIALAIGAVIALLVVFSDDILVAGDNITTLKDVGIATFEVLAEVAGEALAFIEDLFSDLFGTKIKVDLKSTLMFAAAMIDSFVGLFTGAIEAIISVWEALPNSLKGFAVLAINSLISVFEFGINQVISMVNGLIAVINDISDVVGIQALELVPKANLGRIKGEAGTTLEEIGKAAKDGFLRGFDSTTGAEDLVSRIFGKAQDRAALREAQKKFGVDRSTLQGGTGQSTDGRSKGDITFENLQKELKAEQELLNIGQVKGQLEFNQKTAIIKLNQKILESGATLNDTQRKELELLTLSNEEKKIRNALDQQVADFSQDMQDQLNLLKLDTAEREVQADLIQVTNAYRKAGIPFEQEKYDLLKKQREELQQQVLQEQLLQKVFGDQKQALRELAELQRLRAGEQDFGRARGLRSAEIDAERASRQGDLSLSAGALNALGELEKKALDVAGGVEAALTNAFNSAEDALVEFVTTGQFDFSKFVDSILADITRLLARQAILAIFSSLTGGAGGAGAGLFSLFANSGARATGGPVIGGQSYIVGERGPELFQAPSSGTIVPNAALTGQQQPANVTVVNVIDPSMVTAALNDPQNQQVIVNVIGSNKQAVNRQLGK